MNANIGGGTPQRKRKTPKITPPETTPQEIHPEILKLVSEATEALQVVKGIAMAMATLAQSPAAVNLLARFTLLMEAQWIPDSDAATDSNGLAALLNVDQESVRRRMRETKVPAIKGGQANLFRLSDVLRQGATDGEK